MVLCCALARASNARVHQLLQIVSLALAACSRLVRHMQLAVLKYELLLALYLDS
jgi:hypothetical protein